ncbi:hypothetical protein Ddye_024262 [Dipteronia dyeriana]|uniref:Protein kinase domain-containing protein n=1 Tax=Dipteronia dyeriana TaxID=168575 RepID=A0AAD9TVF4_9ROSI|nr:hypothetical protein Ddye_024262 [Dipteronia dyeriana]
MAKNNPLIVIITAFLVQSLIFSSVKAAATHITTDQHALLALKDHITYDPTNLLAKNWSTSSSICTWIGVACGVRHHHRVTVLDISYFGLTGTIPPQLGNLSFLHVLDIRNNSFSGTLPDELAQLRRLKLVNFMFNSFHVEIPSWFGSLSKRQYLSLSRNNLNKSNSLSGGLPSDICNYLPNLERLYLSCNMFDGHIPSTTSKCQKLQTLSLSINNFTGHIPKEIGNMSMLKELYLGINKLRGHLPSSIDSGLPNLERLYLRDNNFIGTIPKSISNVSKLSVLNMANNLISGHLPSSIGLRLPNLERLYLWGNELDGVIPNSISNASQLIILALNHNSFSGPVPTTLGELRYLQRLNIGSNQLTREPSTQELTFLSSLTNCQHLKRLVLSNNPMDGTLPTSIGNLSGIQTFLARNCKIKGNIPQGYNKFFGSVPSCLGDITSLRVLYLNSNNLTSTIPSSFWNLKDILDLNLSNNSLIGKLPLDIGNLRAVTYIDLAWNELSGEIPNSIGNLQTLIIFSIAHNKLKGRIPESFGNLISLELLELSSNNISGAIPKSLEKLRYLKYFNVSFNRLDGEIPTGGAFANFSAESFIGNGQLCGALRLQVPPCKTGTIRKSKMTKLVILICILLAIASAMVTLPLTILWFRSQKRKGNSLDREDVSILAAWRRIPYEELYHATNGFDESNLLGMGGFGSVSKGKLFDGMDIAAKVFNLQVERALKSFDDECKVMSKICHRNLVKIIGCCSNLDFKALVLEYMPNGSLEQWLYSHNYCVDILRRLDIMIDVASALEYLHHGYGTPIVHCDLKPSNVLLDKDMVAHVGDFGIAKLLSEEDSLTQTHTLATIGYMAPGFIFFLLTMNNIELNCRVRFRRNCFCKRGCVQPRKKPTDIMFEGGISLKCWVKDALPNSVTEVADTNLLGGENFTATKDCISSILELAVDCSADSPERRLDITNVLSALANIRTIFQKRVART